MIQNDIFVIGLDRRNHTLMVSCARLDVVTATVTVMAGGTATQNFDLTRNLPVGQFTVSADREWAAATVPEQKIQNVKKTVALDSFGGFLKNELIIRGQSYP